MILHAVGEYELSLRFLEHALALNIKYHGPKSLKVAVSYHLVARTQSCMGDFRSALNSEKETYAIYKQQVRKLYQCFQEVNLIFLFLAWRNSRQDSGVFRVSSSFDSTSCCTSEKDERHLHEWKARHRIASNPYSASVNGKCFGHA